MNPAAADATPPATSSATRPDCVLGFDYGARRIGVAVGNRFTCGARPLGIIANRDDSPDWTAIDALVAEWRPGALVVGLPLTLDGEEQATSRAARAFAAALEKRYNLAAHLADERLSSVEAGRRFAARRAAGTARRKHAAEIDAVAAEIITETWLAHSS